MTNEKNPLPTSCSDFMDDPKRFLYNQALAAPCFRFVTVSPINIIGYQEIIDNFFVEMWRNRKLYDNLMGNIEVVDERMHFHFVCNAYDVQKFGQWINHMKNVIKWNVVSKSTPPVLGYDYMTKDKMACHYTFPISPYYTLFTLHQYISKKKAQRLERLRKLRSLKYSKMDPIELKPIPSCFLMDVSEAE